MGSWIGSIKKYISNVQEEVSNLENENFEDKSHRYKKRKT